MSRASSILLLAAALLLVAAAPARADDDWLPPDRLSGLVGTYARLAPAAGDGQIVYVALGGSDGFRAAGPYTRIVEGDGSSVLAWQRGRYLAIASNPAIGAVITFLDEDGQARDSYAILGVRRDPLGGRITALELVRDRAPIVLYRVGL